ncbi:MAG: 6-phosphogluconolactonase, partial [Bacteroidota bacterium]
MIHIYKDGQEVATQFADYLMWQTRQSRGAYHIALSGGSTPKLLFQVMAEQYANQFNWNQIHFWWGDERCVSAHDEQSNYKM